MVILGKSSIKWRQRPDMTLAVDWDVKHLKQTDMVTLAYFQSYIILICMSNLFYMNSTSARFFIQNINVWKTFVKGNHSALNLPEVHWMAL